MPIKSKWHALPPPYHAMVKTLNHESDLFCLWIIKRPCDHNGAIEIYTLSHGGNWNQQGDVSLWCCLRPFVVVWWHFHVAGRTFEEILQHLKKKHYKDFLACWLWWLAICVCKTWLSGLSWVGLNVCECAGKAESHPGRWVSSQSCLAKVL